MDAVDKYRAGIARRFIRGSGIEIGAFGRPLDVNDIASVVYVDKFSVEDAARHHAMAVDQGMVRPDVLDTDGSLSMIEDGSLDFVAMCHVLEHCEDVIGTIKTHARKLKTGGVLFYVLPDKDRMFDRVRSSTQLMHLIADHFDGGASSRDDHIREWCDTVFPGADEAAVRKEVCQIHFHAWSANAQLGLWRDMTSAVGHLRICEMSVSDDWPEIATVLRKL